MKFFSLMTLVTFNSLLPASLFLNILKNRTQQISPMTLFVIGFGLGPALYSSLLYYAFLLFPEERNFVTFYFLPSTYFVMLLLSFPTLGHTLRVILKFLKDDLLFSIFLLLVSVTTIFFIMQNPLMGHDVLEYATQGRVFFQDFSIPYGPTRFQESSNFFYVGLHGFTFPLLATLEQILNSILNIESDFYFRSITQIYSLLLITLQYLLIRPLGRFFSLTTVMGFFFTPIFFEMIYSYHIDAFRIFFSATALYAMCLLARSPQDKILPTLLGLLGGVMALSHSLGVFFLVLMLAALCFSLQASWRHRARLVVYISLISILMGNIHYLIDIIWGTGWLFQNLKFY